MKYFERNKDYKFELAGYHSQQVPVNETVTTPFIHLSMGCINLSAGYAWDGSSIPLKGFFKAITFGKYDGDRYCKEASLVHDAFYQLMRLNLLSRDHKDTIDRLYEKMCIEGATKIIMALYIVDYDKISDSDIPYGTKRKKWKELHKKRERQLKSLPAWAARRYWAVSKFGARTLKPRYRPEKVILST